jgi:hypothetical protein
MSSGLSTTDSNDSQSNHGEQANATDSEQCQA